MKALRISGRRFAARTSVAALLVALLVAECVQLATKIEAQLDKIAEHLEKAANTQASQPDQPPLRLVPRLTRTLAYRRSRLG